MSIILGNQTIESLILWGDVADYIRSDLSQYLSLIQKIQELQSGISPEQRSEITKLLPLYTSLNEKQRQLDAFKAKAKELWSEEEKADFARLTAEINQMATESLAENPETMSLLFNNKALEDSTRENIDELNKQKVELRNSILEKIADATDPVIEKAIFKKLTSLQKDQLIYATINEPENNLDQAFFRLMGQLNPSLSLPHQASSPSISE
jgi:hypothetical protein